MTTGQSAEGHRVADLCRRDIRSVMYNNMLCATSVSAPASATHHANFGAIRPTCIHSGNVRIGWQACRGGVGSGRVQVSDWRGQHTCEFSSVASHRLQWHQRHPCWRLRKSPAAVMSPEYVQWCAPGLLWPSCRSSLCEACVQP